VNGSTASVDAARLWAGGCATAVVAALTTVAGVVIARGVFDLAIVAPPSAGTWGDDTTFWFAAVAAMCALSATALVHLLLTFTPRPMRFFAWVMALATVVAVLVPLVAEGSPGARLAVGFLNLVLGIEIGSLVAGTAASAVRSARRPGVDEYYQR
jgi:hypothetical protein